jgi:tRNA(Arg) A34 adenosine deaminase TadA
MRRPPHPSARVEYPDWVDTVADWQRSYGSDAERMQLAIEVSRANVERASGGPFGAAVFEAASGRLVALGMNSVVRARNSALHAEVVALMLAQQRVGSYTLRAPGLPEHELFSSCDPCAMCLGAALWSGVGRLVCAASRDDAARIGFEEGPVFEQSWVYLEARGLRVERGLHAAEARAVLDLYAARGGAIYNG